MSDFNDQPSGIRVVGQIPLNPKEYAVNQASLKNLGADNNLAFTYHDGMVVFCIEEKTRWEWREAVGAEVGLLDDNFIYPDNVAVAMGVDYSLKSYNFFELICLPTPIPYYELRVVEKGIVNSVPNVLSTLEIGDTVQGRKDEFTVWTAIYNGGDPVDRANYTAVTEIMFVGDPGNLPNPNPYQGPSAYQVAVDNGFVGTEVEWLASLHGNDGADGNDGAPGGNGADGADGNSAYEIAVSNGFVGTQAEWLTSLQGENGTNGNDGLDASNNLQKDVFANYEIVDGDNNYVIQIFNGVDPVTITVPSTGLRDKFNCGFIRKGTGAVLFVGAVGVTLFNSVGFRIKEQHDCAYLERDKGTQNYALLGTTKA